MGKCWIRIGWIKVVQSLAFSKQLQGSFKRLPNEFINHYVVLRRAVWAWVSCNLFNKNPWCWPPIQRQGLQLLTPDLFDLMTHSVHGLFQRGH